MEGGCERFARSTGERCRREQLGRSPFCWQHQPKGTITLAAVLTFLIGAGASWGISAFFYAKSADDLARHDYLKSERELPRLGLDDRRKPFCYLMVGGHEFAIDGINRPSPLGGLCPFEVGLSMDRELMLYGDIWGPDGEVAVRLQGSLVTVEPSVGFDINSDAYALEVVDPIGRPVLQVRRTGPITFALQYRVKRSTGGVREYWIADEAGLRLAWINSRGERWTRLFKYPGYKNPGVKDPVRGGIPEPLPIIGVPDSAHVGQ